MRDEIVGIQYLRGFAAMLVVFYHAPGQVATIHIDPGYFVSGQGGVDIFFVISGFLMYRVTKARGESLSAIGFIRDRIIRIVPLYWLVTGFIAFAVLVAPSHFKTTELTLDHLLLSLGFIPHYDPGHPSDIWPLLVPGWTLNYEMFFYAVFAGLVAMRWHGRLLPAASIFTMLVITGYFYSGHNALVLTYTNSLMLEFIFGMAIAAAYERQTFKPRYLAVLLMPAGLIGLFALHGILPAGLRVLSWGVPAMAIMIGMLAAEPWIAERKVRLLEYIGNASYSIYLSHLLTLGVVREVWLHLPISRGSTSATIIYLATAIGASALAGCIVYRLIERPMTMAFKSRNRKRLIAA
jgi:exopolysaccharide production protein ExoZ